MTDSIPTYYEVTALVNSKRALDATSNELISNEFTIEDISIADDTGSLLHKNDKGRKCLYDRHKGLPKTSNSTKHELAYAWTLGMVNAVPILLGIVVTVAYDIDAALNFADILIYDILLGSLLGATIGACITWIIHTMHLSNQSNMTSCGFTIWIHVKTTVQLRNAFLILNKFGAKDINSQQLSMSA